MPLARLSPGRTALVLIDIQHHTTTRGEGQDAEARLRGIAGEFDEYYQQAEAAIRNVSKLLAACRARAIDIVHVVKADDGNVSRQFRLGGLTLPNAESASDDIRPEAAPQDRETIIPRGVYSPFSTSDLEAHLKARGVETVILAGMLANVTIALAAREAADRSFDVLVVHDACASETLEWHGLTMQGIGGGGIRVLWAQDILDMLEGTRQ
nr:cysteine hydrolase [Microvirga antarctica]